MANLFEEIQPIVYKNAKVFFLDQTVLPAETKWVEVNSVEICWDAIRRLIVRGAPAIGIAVAFGMLVASRAAPKSSFEEYYSHMKNTGEYLATARPTAVNLFWALKRMDKKILASREKPLSEMDTIMESEALAIQKEDEEVCRAIGIHGQEIFSRTSCAKDKFTILTHCNAGSLATSKYGTALAPIYVSRERGLNVRVFVDETRPLLQGSRLTAYELYTSGVDVTVITDSMAASVMGKDWIDACIVGCDRVAANGDAANKIGTYGVALLARAHNIPFYVACPLSTVDLDTKCGSDIEIEERDPAEVTEGMGKRTAPYGVKVYNPAFDVTPHELISGIITEKGLIRPPYAKALAELLQARYSGLHN